MVTQAIDHFGLKRKERNVDHNQILAYRKKQEPNLGDISKTI